MPEPGDHPARQRKECLSTSAGVGRTALHLPRGLSLAEQWQRAGWLSPEPGRRAGQVSRRERGVSFFPGCRRVRYLHNRSPDTRSEEVGPAKACILAADAEQEAARAEFITYITYIIYHLYNLSFIDLRR